MNERLEQVGGIADAAQGEQNAHETVIDLARRMMATEPKASHTTYVAGALKDCQTLARELLRIDGVESQEESARMICEADPTMPPWELSERAIAVAEAYLKMRGIEI